MTDSDSLDRLRRLCLAFPEVTERLSHGGPSWFIRSRRMFATFTDHRHDQPGGFWCAAPAGEAAALVSTDGRRYFTPPYVGHRGWLGVRLDVPDIDWDEVAELLEDAFRTVAPATLTARLTEGSVPDPAGGRR